MFDALLIDRDVPALDTDWPRVSGARLAAQNIVESIYTPVGSLPWDRAAGSVLWQLINAPARTDEVIAEFRRVALTIDDVWPQSVVVTYDPLRGERGEYHIGFNGPAFDRSVGPVTMRVPASVVEPAPAQPGNLLQIAPGSFLLVRPGEALAV